MPILVMHGDADTLILPEQAEALARTNKRAQFVMVEGMGHDLIGNPGIYPRIAAFAYDAN